MYTCKIYTIILLVRVFHKFPLHYLTFRLFEFTPGISEANDPWCIIER